MWPDGIALFDARKVTHVEYKPEAAERARVVVYFTSGLWTVSDELDADDAIQMIERIEGTMIAGLK